MLFENKNQLTHHRWNILKFLSSHPRMRERAIWKHDEDHTRAFVFHRNSWAIPKALSQPIPLNQGPCELYGGRELAQKKQWFFFFFFNKVVVWKRLRIQGVYHLVMCPILVITLTWYQDVLHSFLSPPIKGPTQSDWSSQRVIPSSS